MVTSGSVPRPTGPSGGRLPVPEPDPEPGIEPGAERGAEPASAFDAKPDADQDEGAVPRTARGSARSEDEPLGELSHLSTEEIIAELQRRQEQIRDAHQRRTRLLQNLAGVEMEILRLGGSIPGRSTQPVGAPPPPGNGGSASSPPAADLNGLTLPRAIAQVVRIGEVFSPREAAERLKEAGYRTRAQHFSTAVTQALGRDKRFRRVGHGQYERLG